jgi:hypothetical protein
MEFNSNETNGVLWKMVSKIKSKRKNLEGNFLRLLKWEVRVAEVQMYILWQGGQAWSLSSWLEKMLVGARSVSRREECHVVADANSHELETPEPDHYVWVSYN